MAEGSGKASVISLADNFGALVVQGGGIKVELSSSGNIVVYTNGDLPQTNQRMYAAPADAPLIYTFNQAQKYAATLDAHGHRDWRVPTKGELNVL